MNKREGIASNSGSLPYWSGPTCNNDTSVVKTDLSQRSYYFVKIANNKDIDYRSMSESAKKNHYLSHEVEEEEEDEEDTDTAPILANTRVVTSNRFNKKNSSKPRTNIKKHKNAPCSNIGCESTSLIVDQISNPRTNTAFLRNNNCNTSKNNCMIGRCASGEPGHCDGFHSNCLHLPPPLINNSYPSDPHCCLDESNSSIPAEVFAAKVCFVKKGQVVSPQGPTPNLSVAAAGNYQAGEENLQLNGSATSSLLNPVPSFSSLPKSSLFSPATTTNSASAVVTLSSNVEDIVAVREGEFSNGVEEGGISLPPVGGRRGRSTTTCSSFAYLSSAPGAGCSATSSSLPAWSSPHAMGEHCHPAQASNNQVDKLARNQLIAVSVLCCIFMTCEIVGGILSNSLALFTDVLHLGSDLISFSIGLLALYLSIKPATESMSFGYHRIEVLGAVISVLLIWLVSGILCYIATERIITENYKNVYADEMLLTASLGVLFNIIMGFVLHSNFCCKSAAVKNHGHSHSHIHNGHSGANSQQMYHRLSQEPTENTPAIVECHPLSKPKQNVNIRAAIIHVIGDIIQSTGVLVAALIIKFTEKEEYKLADPICTFIFSIIVLCTTFNVIRDTLFVIMEGVPHDISYKKIRSELETLDHVKMVHNLCVWSLTLNKNAVSVHLALDEVADTQIILEGATAMLRQRYNFQFITIQVERYLPTMSQCPECLTPS